MAGHPRRGRMAQPTGAGDVDARMRPRGIRNVP